ncbi:MAG TPA: L-histidine N(alpha)-methyltransferase [Phycisphaerae bacterium]|nr:L-histidine N(alpha)-methyltransferase [Phycisphaerae bacterium]
MIFQETNQPASRSSSTAFEPRSEILEEVLKGLASQPKELPSRYLYDRRGAELFEEICQLDEYYIPRIELEILDLALSEVADAVGHDALVIEPGSGAATKTRLLLSRLHSPAAYVPVDLSEAQLLASADQLAREFPRITVKPICADFTGPFDLPRLDRPIGRRLVFFPGSTIGNFLPDSAMKVLRRIRSLIGPHGLLLIGVDLRKDARIIEAAYDDSAGISAAFAMNYLARLNRECQADFHLDRFSYEAVYNSHLGRVEMCLVSLSDQNVVIAGRPIAFRAGERIRTEVSYKYTLEAFGAVSGLAGLIVDRIWTDPSRFFSVQLLRSA